MGSTPAPGTYSASQISTLIGLNPYQTPLAGFQTMKEKAEPGWNAAHGYTLPPEPEGAALRWGLAFEDAIIKLAEEKEGRQIIFKEELFKKTLNDITLSCHIDGAFSYDPSKETRELSTLHEGKTTNHWAYTSTKKEIQENIDFTTGKIEPGFQIIRRWGDPGSDNVPQEYQIQGAVQRICAGAELVKLSVLVFPKGQDEFEALGWVISSYTNSNGTFPVLVKDIPEKSPIIEPINWARTIEQMGNFHQYSLPSNPALETAIIESVQRFDRDHMKPGIPPTPTDFADVRRLLPNPMGTVIATPDLVTLCREYSENVRQLGTASPIRARQEILKTQIADTANQLRRSDPTSPPDKFLILDPNGGDQLASVSADKNGVISFRAARAK